MARNWAIAIGINDYNPNNFPPLTCAKQDAEAMRDFFLNEASFDEVCFFTDDSPKMTLPNGNTTPTYPSCGNLLSFLQDRFAQPFLSKGDNCWFFFAGHGQQYQNRDYLIPIDAPNPRGAEPTYAIPVSYVRERLSRSGADNVILLLDACRNESSRDANRPEWEPQQGIVTISACSPLQRSWEIAALQHGAFTYALLEALRIPGERNCATVERLDNYLRYRVPQLCRDYGMVPEQVPRIAADPAEKLHFILLPKHATQADIATLKNDAYRFAFVEPDLAFAEQLCIRANAAAMGRDMEILRLYAKVEQLKSQSPQPAPPAPQLIGDGGVRSPSSVETELKDNPSAPPPTKPAPPQAEADLSSEKGIDYTKLRDLLKAQQWKEADQETYEVMIRAVGKESGDWFTSDELLNFPCKDLKTIDSLWVKYSNGHFGFSVQKQIYVECGGKLDGKYPGDGIWRKFGDRVGWRKDGNWLDYPDLNPSLFSSLRFLNLSPFSSKGLFPGFGCFGFGLGLLGWLLCSLLSHRDL